MVLPAAVAILAILIDRTIGDPPSRYHPVALLGRFIGWWGRPPLYPVPLQRSMGLLLWFITTALFILPFFLVERFTPFPLYFLIAPFLLKACFAWRSLEEHASSVVHAIDRSIVEARIQAGRMVSRPTETLEREQLLSAAYESVAENIVDSITAPLLFYFAGEILGGLGLAFAALYRAANTMDAMLGYPDERGRLGWAAARIDDILNFVPARITGTLILCYFLSRGRGREAWFAFSRDHRKRPGINGGIPMSLLAGGVGVQFEKPGAYRIGIPERSLEDAGEDFMHHSNTIVIGFLTILVVALFLLGLPANV
ncbi:MAG: adenosylcobinamide-phosphate synthase CbiB [Methanomicrobiales archaeon]|nr:adenosylcobinamide-phosphate synthase CbiB [Methanomicrobiales archaeon]